MSRDECQEPVVGSEGKSVVEKWKAVRKRNMRCKVIAVEACCSVVSVDNDIIEF